MSYKPRKGVGACAKALFEDLAGLQYHGVMFGHQDASLTGCLNDSTKWEAPKAGQVKPDVERVSGKCPAVFGFDFGWLTEKEVFPVSPPLFADPEEAFQFHQSLAYACHEAGGIVTFSWHVANAFTVDLAALVAKIEAAEQDKKGSLLQTAFIRNGRPIGNGDPDAAGGATALDKDGKLHPKLTEKLTIIADFAKSLVSSEGAPIPILFRPWHENNLDWWWWCRKASRDGDYKALWQETVKFLDGAGATNLLYVYSPNVLDSKAAFKASFEATYPGPEWVDVLGIDFYPENRPVKSLVDQVDYLCEHAQKEEKLAAISECGLKCLKRNDLPVEFYWTSDYLEPFWHRDENLISYALTWKNVDPVLEFYGPYPGHGSATNFNLMAANVLAMLSSRSNFRKKVLFRDDVLAKRADFARWQTPCTP